SMIAPTSRPSLFSSWWRGFLTDFFNPKIGVFYIAVIPQFLVSGVGNLQMGLSLGLIHAIEGGVILTVVACAAATFSAKLTSSRGKSILSIVTGGVMALLGGATILDVVRSHTA
ncbi:MAG: LysE family transporter, partial [Bifidobacterium sp.]|nr:LysE family transporter [Bifidobacterium sp.]